MKRRRMVVIWEIVGVTVEEATDRYLGWTPLEEGEKPVSLSLR